jgi:hypothetical protein
MDKEHNKPLIYRFQTIKMTVKKLYTIFLVIAMVGCLALTISYAGLLMDHVIIGNKGQLFLSSVTAKSGHWRDIQEAINYVVTHGGKGNVYIPEGTWNFINPGETWTGARVIVPAGISIFGASTTRYPNGSVAEWKTVLVMPTDVPGNDTVGIPVWFQFGSEYSLGYNSRFSDIKLVGYRTFNQNSTSMHIGVRIYNVYDFRVDHCYFLNTAGGGVHVFGSSNPDEPLELYTTRGVIDHSLFINTYALVVPYDKRTADYGVFVSRGNYGERGWETDSTQVLGQYTNYTVFVEDCYFEKWRHSVATGRGGHIVVRYSTVKYDYGYGSIDIHGDPPGRALEIYNCTITVAINEPYGQEWAAWIRGGAGVAFNNTVGGGTYLYFMLLTNEYPDNETFWVHDWWIWNNTMIEGCTELYVSPNINLNEDYFLYEPEWYQPYPYPHPLTYV